MKYSKERIEELKTRIRKMVVYQERVSCRQVAAALKIDRNFAAKLLREMREENKYKIEHQMINRKVAMIEDAFSESMRIQWRIVHNNERRKKEFFKKNPELDAFGKPIPYKVEYGGYIVSTATKIRALRAIRETQSRLFEMMMEAGVFSKKDVAPSDIPMDNLIQKINEMFGGNSFQWQKNEETGKYKADIQHLDIRD